MPSRPHGSHAEVARALRVREWATRLTLVLAGVSVALALGEIGVRAAGIGSGPPPSVARVIAPRYRGMLDCYPSNPRQYFDIDLREPASRTRFHHLAPRRWEGLCRRTPWAVEFRYNHLRFRDPAPSPPPPGRTRIVVLGDSFTEGQGVREGDTLPHVLGDRLERAEPGRWEVRNCGRRGTDFPALRKVFDQAMSAYEPDVVIWAMVLNDAERDEAYEARQRYVNDWILLNMDSDAETPMPRTLRLLQFLEDRVLTARVAWETTRWYREMYGPANADGWARTQEHIRHMDRTVRSRGGRFIVAVWPLLVGLDGVYPFGEVHHTVRAFFLKAGIESVDLLPTFRGTDARTLWVHEVDRHPNEIALRRAAEVLEPHVRSGGPGVTPGR